MPRIDLRRWIVILPRWFRCLGSWLLPSMLAWPVGRPVPMRQLTRAAGAPRRVLHLLGSKVVEPTLGTPGVRVRLQTIGEDPVVAPRAHKIRITHRGRVGRKLFLSAAGPLGSTTMWLGVLIIIFLPHLFLGGRGKVGATTDRCNAGCCSRTALFPATAAPKCCSCCLGAFLSRSHCKKKQDNRTSRSRHPLWVTGPQAS